MCFRTLNPKFQKNQTKTEAAQGYKQIEAAEHSWSANFGGSPAKQGRAGAASVLVQIFLNFGFKVLKHIQNGCLILTLFEKMVNHSNVHTYSSKF